MPPTNLCRLCFKICQGGKKSLYHENGCKTLIYEIIHKYFHPSIVDLEEAQHLTALCLLCWHHVCDIHSFETEIRVAQLKLIRAEGEVGLLKNSEEVWEVKSESSVEEIVYEQSDLNMEKGYCVVPSEETTMAASEPELEDITESECNETVANNTSLCHYKDTLLEIVERCPDENRHYQSASVMTTEKLAASGKPIGFETINRHKSNDGLIENPADRQVEDVFKHPSKRLTRKPSLNQKEIQTLDDRIAKWIPNIKCIACLATWSKYSLYRQHFREEHSSKEFCISCCNHKLLGNNEILEHMLFHEEQSQVVPETQDRIYQCTICGEELMTEKDRDYHCANKHPEFGIAVRDNGDVTMFICIECGRSSETFRNITRPRCNMHRVKPKRRCKECGKMFKDDWHLTRHAKTHLNWHPCSLCPTTFKYRRSLLQHEKKVHPVCDIPAYECRLCGMPHQSQTSLNTHMIQQHLGTSGAKYTCRECKQHFNTEERLALHQQLRHKKDRQ